MLYHPCQVYITFILTEPEGNVSIIIVIYMYMYTEQWWYNIFIPLMNHACAYAQQISICYVNRERER